MTAKPRRRWFQVSLRTMFVLVTLFCCWLGYELNWIRQRHEILRHANFSRGTPAPIPLNWLGEEGCYFVLVNPTLTEQEITAIRRVFPEAEVVRWWRPGQAPEVRFYCQQLRSVQATSTTH